MKSATKGIVAVAAALALGLTACQPGAGGGAPSQQPTLSNTGLAQTQAQYNPQPRDMLKDGGTYTTATTEISPQFNTFQVDGTRYTLDLWKWYNPILALFTADGEWSFNPDYLTDVKEEVKDGNTVITYTIRPEATFNDGTPIDWTAFEATWKTSNGSNKAYLVSSSDGYNKMKSVTKGVDDKQVVVTFDGQWAWWRGQFNYILHPKAAADPKVYNEGFVNNPHNEWGAGPYQVKSFDQQAGVITFERNPKWWGDPGKLDARTFKAMEPTASLNAFKNGELDSTSVAAKERLAAVQGMADIEIRKSATPSSALVVLNSAAEPLKDAKVRQAIFTGIDRATIVKVTFDGLGYTETPPGSFNLFPWQEGYADNVATAGLKFDAAAANALLDEAGWAKGGDGFRAKDGKTLELQFPVLGDAPTTKARAAALQAMMKDIGVKLTIQAKPSTEFSNISSKKLFDFFVMGFASSDPFGVAYFCQVWCSDSGLNKSGTGNPELDKKIKEVEAIGKDSEAIAKANEVEVEALKTYGIFPLYNGPTMIATKKGLANAFDSGAVAGLFFVGKPQDVGWMK